MFLSFSELYRTFKCNQDVVKRVNHSVLYIPPGNLQEPAPHVIVLAPHTNVLTISL